MGWPMRRGEPGRQSSRGFTLVAMLAFVSVLGVGLAAVGMVWSTAVQREREAELIRIGVAYAEAIASYRRMSPGTARRGPSSLAALLLDDRTLQTHRHLRRLYEDPLKPGRPWGVLRDASGHIAGVYSQSDEQPLRRVEVRVGDVLLAPATRYSQWKFIVKEPE